MTGKTDREIFPASIADTMETGDRAILESRQPGTEKEVYFSNQENRIVIAERVPVFNHNGDLEGLVICLNEVTEYEQSRQELKNVKQIINHIHNELEHKSLVDILTGLGNRKSFFLQIEQELSHCRRYENDLALALLQPVDLEKISQAFGVSVKDSVLQEIADWIKSSIRDTDSAVRWDSEKFLWLMPRTSVNEAMEVANRIKQAIEQNVQVGIQAPKPTTVAIGVCEYRGGELLEDLLGRTERALERSLESDTHKVVNYQISLLKR
jgi:diguanylate cyclase (GGDEF)-like protein